MPENKRERITKKILELLENNPGGVRYSDIFRKLHEIFPEMPKGNIHGTIYNLRTNEKIIKPERGLFVLKKYAGEIMERRPDTAGGVHLPNETSFYQSFADYLEKNLEECTKAIPLGGNRFCDRWGTPDVFGVYRFAETDIFRPPVEIISAEIKTDTN